MVAISVSNLKKVYSLYNNKFSKIKEAFSTTGKKYHNDFSLLFLKCEYSQFRMVSHINPMVYTLNF